MKILDTLSNFYRVLLIEKRLPYGVSARIQKWLYEKKLNNTLKTSLTTPSFETDNQAGIEVHMVTCMRDMYMAILSLKSLLRFLPPVSVVIHGDETLDLKDVREFESQFHGIRIVNYDDATQDVSRNSIIANLRIEMQNRFQLDSSFERQRKAWALKIFDFHFFSQAEKIMVLDSDTLFLRSPTEILDWISGDGDSFFAEPPFPNLKISQKMQSECFPNIQLIKKFNGGLFGFNKNALPIEKLIEIAQIFINYPDLPLFGDECVWRIAFSQIKCERLDFSTYPLFGSKARYNQNIEYKYMHFLLKHNEGLYNAIASSVIEELRK